MVTTSSQKQLVAFLTRARSASEVAKKLKISLNDARVLLKSGIPNYDLVEGPRNAKNNKTFIAMPALNLGTLPKQEWALGLKDEDADKPYFEILLPEIPEAKKLRVILFDNFAFGGSDHDAKLFQRIIGEVQKPNTFCAFNGDILAPIVSRGKQEDRDRALQNRIQAFAKIMQPVLHKVMWGQQGCMERQTQNTLGVDPIKYFCSKLNIPYYEQPVYVDMYWRDNLFTLMAAHGQSTSQTKGGRENSTERFANQAGATDYVVRGHIGDAMSRPKEMIVRDNSVPTLKAREQYMVVLGGCRKYWKSTAAVKGQTPTSGAILALMLYPDGGRGIKTINERKGEDQDEQ